MRLTIKARSLLDQIRQINSEMEEAERKIRYFRGLGKHQCADVFLDKATKLYSQRGVLSIQLLREGITEDSLRSAIA